MYGHNYISLHNINAIVWFAHANSDNYLNIIKQLAQWHLYNMPLHTDYNTHLSYWSNTVWIALYNRITMFRNCEEGKNI